MPDSYYITGSNCHVLVINGSGPMVRNVVCFAVMFSSVVPQEVINGDCIDVDLVPETDVYWVLLQ